jgi:hypothetical protein
MRQLIGSGSFSLGCAFVFEIERFAYHALELLRTAAVFLQARPGRKNW